MSMGGVEEFGEALSTNENCTHVPKLHSLKPERYEGGKKLKTITAQPKLKFVEP